MHSTHLWVSNAFNPVVKADRSPRYPCTFPECTESFHHRYRLTSHMVSHSDEMTHVCGKCGYACSRKHDLKRHMNTQHQEESHSDFNKPYKCEECECRFMYYANLKTHIHEAHDGPPYKKYRCSTCSKMFTLYYNLKIHRENVCTNTQPYPCNQCDRRYKHKVSLNTHIRQKHPDLVPTPK